MAILEDGSGNPIGYKFLALYNFADFVFAASGDDIFAVPALDEVVLIPFNIAINDGDDQDATNPRDIQVQWSTKPNANSQWWNTPSQWMTVAVVGASVTATAIEDEVLPETFTLEQNYPNPFNPATNIAFTLPTAENVTLTVYNVLGQKVATLLNNQSMHVGNHSIQFDASQLASGTYLYRLDAGSSFSMSRTMVLLK